eukprot:GHVN01083676.1.p1 GENE.GHVN01083676.1~~GHVN01083676.1.p1  ORF type:complete len:131 (+),score=14.65 GHVN01083676.1:225-617(+)
MLGWDVFMFISTVYLSRLTSTTVIGSVTVQLIHSIVGQSLLPVQRRWTRILRADKAQAQRGRHYGSLVLPILSSVNLLCRIHPLVCPDYSPLLPVLMDNFPTLYTANEKTLTGSEMGAGVGKGTPIRGVG